MPNVFFGSAGHVMYVVLTFVPTISNTKLWISLSVIRFMWPFRTFLSQICNGLLPILYKIDKNPDWNVFLNMIHFDLVLSSTLEVFETIIWCERISSCDSVLGVLFRLMFCCFGQLPLRQQSIWTVKMPMPDKLPVSAFRNSPLCFQVEMNWNILSIDTNKYFIRKLSYKNAFRSLMHMLLRP